MKRRFGSSRHRWKPYVPPSYRKKRAKKILLIIGVILLLAALAVGFFFARRPLEEALERFRGIFSGGAGRTGFAVHCIDVGQADAALVLCDGEAMLIDGGNKADAGAIYLYLKNQGVKELSYIVATHPHEDHMGGLPGAMFQAKARHALSPVSADDTVFFKTFTTFLEKQGTALAVPRPGDTFTLGSAAVEVLGPIDRTTPYTNDMSLVLRVTYGDTAFLFTGDGEEAEEQTILASGRAVKSTVLKVGHHGSTFATAAAFLQAVDPDCAVISAGAGNENGHPAPALLRRLKEAGVKVYRTDMQGTVVCTSDGEHVYFTTERGGRADTFAPADAVPARPEPEEGAWVLNTATKKFHRMFCLSAVQMDDGKRKIFEGSREELLDMGYEPCSWCGEIDTE